MESPPDNRDPLANNDPSILDLVGKQILKQILLAFNKELSRQHDQDLVLMVQRSETGGLGIRSLLSIVYNGGQHNYISDAAKL